MVVCLYLSSIHASNRRVWVRVIFFNGFKNLDLRTRYLTKGYMEIGCHVYRVFKKKKLQLFHSRGKIVVGAMYAVI